MFPGVCASRSWWLRLTGQAGSRKRPSGVRAQAEPKVPHLCFQGCRLVSGESQQIQAELHLLAVLLSPAPLPMLPPHVQRAQPSFGQLIRNPRDTYSSPLSFSDQFSNPIKTSSDSLTHLFSQAPGLVLSILPLNNVFAVSSAPLCMTAKVNKALEVHF